MKLLILILPFLFILMGASSCSTARVQYRADTVAVTSAKGNSMEFPVLVDGSICKDMDGNVGMCAKHLPAKKDLIITLSKRPYAFSLDVQCSREVNFEQSFDVISGIEFKVTVPKENFKDVAVFNCLGRITPHDRDGVSSRFEVRVRPISDEYIKREQAYIIEDGKKILLVLGENALYSSVLINGEWKTYTKKAVIEIPNKDVKAISESYAQRFNYINF